MDQGYSISTTAQLTGLSTYVIRAWEKRYKVVVPKRSAGNQRTYSADDVNRLRILAKAVAAGHRIGDVVSMKDEQIEELLGTWDSTSRDQIDARELVDQCLEKIRGMDAAGLHDLLEQSVIDRGIIAALDDILVPLMREIGEAWRKNTLRIYHEHMASSVVRTFLGRYLRSADLPTQSAVAVVAGPAGQNHDFGGLVIAVAAATAGFLVHHLGSDLPSEEILQSVSSTKADLLLMSIVFPGNNQVVRRELEQIRRYLPSSCRLILGGPSADTFRTDQSEKAPRDLREFRDMMLNLRKDKAEKENPVPGIRAKSDIS